MERLSGRWLSVYRLCMAAFGGALIPFSFAPHRIWPAAIIGLFFIAFSVRNATPIQAVLRVFTAGLGLFGVGVSWVFVAISHFGNSSTEIAVTLTTLFVVALSIALAIPFYWYGKFLSRSPLGQTLGFTAVWVISEWLRSWLFTGFPWLYVGYSHINTPLNGYAPLLGIFGVSFFTCLSAVALLVAFYYFKHKQRYTTIAIAISATLLTWLGGFCLQQVQWTQTKPHAIKIGLVQPNIPQEHKWNPTYYSETLDIFSELSEPLWDLDWVIWPEAAVPYPFHQAAPLLKQIDDFSRQRGTVFITGIIYDDYEAYKYYNAIIARGAGGGEYFKQRLVPFGEYVPFEEQLRGIIAFFNLPTSIIHVGPFSKKGLNANGVLIAAAICYEIVYPDLIAELATDKDVILTISNDAWFGKSNGPLQHFDMARMRAIETGRYVIRGTNNGISGFIDPSGKVIQQGGRFTRETIQGQVIRMTGATPFMIWKSWPVIFVSLLLFLCCAKLQRKRLLDNTFNNRTQSNWYNSPA